MKSYLHIARLTVILSAVMFIASLSWASQHDFSGPSSDFMENNLSIRTDTGTSGLSIRLIEFLIGIQTERTWEKISDNHWILKTSFRDPVIEANRTYSIEFLKTGNSVVMSSVSFDSHTFSTAEMKSFADHIIKNFGKHISVK